MLLTVYNEGMQNNEGKFSFSGCPIGGTFAELTRLAVGPSLFMHFVGLPHICLGLRCLLLSRGRQLFNVACTAENCCETTYECESLSQQVQQTKSADAMSTPQHHQSCMRTILATSWTLSSRGIKEHKGLLVCRPPQMCFDVYRLADTLKSHSMSITASLNGWQWQT